MEHRRTFISSEHYLPSLVREGDLIIACHLIPREPDDDDLYDDDGILFRAFLVGGIPICATRPLPFRIRQDKLR